MHTLYHALVAQVQEIFDRDIQGYKHNTTMLWGAVLPALRAHPAAVIQCVGVVSSLYGAAPGSPSVVGSGACAEAREAGNDAGVAAREREGVWRGSSSGSAKSQYLLGCTRRCSHIIFSFACLIVFGLLLFFRMLLKPPF